MQDGVVLDGGGDDMVATAAFGVGDPLDRQVIGLRAATGKDNLHRATPQHARDGLVGGLQRVQALASQAVDAAGIAETLGEIREHRGENGGVNRSGCRVIHVDDAIAEWHTICSASWGKVNYDIPSSVPSYHQPGMENQRTAPLTGCLSDVTMYTIPP